MIKNILHRFGIHNWRKYQFGKYCTICQIEEELDTMTKKKQQVKISGTSSNEVSYMSGTALKAKKVLKGRLMKDIYYEQAKPTGKCSRCGNTETYTYKGRGKRKNDTFPMPFYFRAYRKSGWFRSNDEYLGVVCKDCIN